ncbi:MULTISPECIES: glycosyltransferase family 4 protein [unclassified Mycobacterium]|uniref:glycosyltransferase family 4 protein n=1 Tax=unclassified Mycobacterium TaxID=2642494 RepID=UPI0029C88A17|nr:MULTISPECIES: glycosyltransferase family 4 protein [unclassified Mycobacterium]
MSESTVGAHESTASATSVRYPIRVLTIGPAPTSPNSRGGMATVAEHMVGDPDTRFRIRAVPTYMDGSSVVRLSIGVWGMVKASVLVLCGRVDVLHAHVSLRGSIVRKAVPLFVARLRGVATIVHCHGANFFEWMDALPAPARRAVRAALRADYCLVLGQSQVDECRRSLDLDDSNMRVLYNPVVVPLNPPVRHGRGELRAVSLGRLGARKGTYDLIRAAGLLPEDVRAGLPITLAGDGEVEQAREFVHRNGLDDAIDIVGWVGPEERDRLLAESAIMVLPSYHEGLPMAILEAMAHGVVPVTTPVGAIPEVITDGVDGLLVAPGDAEQLAAALRSLVVDDELRNRLSAAARARMSAFDITQWREALHELWIAAARR